MVIITLTVPCWQKTARMAEAKSAGKADALIPAAELSINLLQSIVEGITGVDRKIAIGFKNLTPVSSYHSRNRHC